MSRRFDLDENFGAYGAPATLRRSRVGGFTFTGQAARLAGRQVFTGTAAGYAGKAGRASVRQMRGFRPTNPQKGQRLTGVLRSQVATRKAQGFVVGSKKAGTFTPSASSYQPDPMAALQAQAYAAQQQAYAQSQAQGQSSPSSYFLPQGEATLPQGEQPAQQQAPETGVQGAVEQTAPTYYARSRERRGLPPVPPEAGSLLKQVGAYVAEAMQSDTDFGGSTEGTLSNVFARAAEEANAAGDNVTAQTLVALSGMWARRAPQEPRGLSQPDMQRLPAQADPGAEGEGEGEGEVAGFFLPNQFYPAMKHPYTPIWNGRTLVTGPPGYGAAAATVASKGSGSMVGVWALGAAAYGIFSDKGNRGMEGKAVRALAFGAVGALGAFLAEYLIAKVKL